MKGSSLRFYMHENRRHQGKPLYEWLLEKARERGVGGGTAFRAIAGFGRHGVIEEQSFFELAGAATVMVELVVGDADAEALLKLAEGAGAPIFHVRVAAEFGVIGNADGSTDASSAE